MDIISDETLGLRFLLITIHNHFNTFRFKGSKRILRISQSRTVCVVFMSVNTDWNLTVKRLGFRSYWVNVFINPYENVLFYLNWIVKLYSAVRWTKCFCLFSRVSPDMNLHDLRDSIGKLCGNETFFPHEFIFLRSVGRCLTRVKSKQELDLKVKNYRPPQVKKQSFLKKWIDRICF